jgi:hypothetical protein
VVNNIVNIVIIMNIYLYFKKKIENVNSLIDTVALNQYKNLTMKINIPDNKNLNDSSIIFRVKSRKVNRLDLMDQNST